MCALSCLCQGFFEWAYTPTYRGCSHFLGYYGGEEDYYSHNAGGYDFHRDRQVDRSVKGEYSAFLFAKGE